MTIASQILNKQKGILKVFRSIKMVIRANREAKRIIFSAAKPPNTYLSNGKSRFYECL
jgi:hypothetical protein